MRIFNTENESVTGLLETPVPIDSFVQEVKPGISLVTCCMNRTANLIKALKTWLEFEEINQIVIVDWSSRSSVSADLRTVGIKDNRILVARVGDQSRWILSYAFNFGFRLAGYDKILKTDADIMIRSNFFRDNVLHEKTFLSGDWRVAEKGQEHINGFFMVHREDLFSVGGFNEYITSYGWDDDDLYIRMEQLGLNRVRIKKSGIYHIPHDNAQRIIREGYMTCALDLMRLEPGSKIMGNRMLTSAMPLWDQNRVLTPFVITKLLSGYLEAYQSGESFYQVPNHVREDADYYGLCALLSWYTDLGVYLITKNNLYALLTSRVNPEDITRMDVRLAACMDKPCCWFKRVVVLYFEPKCLLNSVTLLIKKLSIAAKKHDFTLFVEPDYYDLLTIDPLSGNVSNIHPIPTGFNAHDLTKGHTNDLVELPVAFDNTPAFWVTVTSTDLDICLLNP